MKRGFIVALAISVISSFVLSAPGAGTRRALVVGIGTYRPEGMKIPPTRGWSNLKGAVHDAVAFGDVLRIRFGFGPGDITMLLDRKASRQAILGGLKKLADSSEKGDTAVFYYAGHGSQVKNTSTRENDRLDESIVPADSVEGADDIRDKELARVFHSMLDRGVRLVVVMDTCHTMAGARAALSPASVTARYCARSEQVVDDGYRPEKSAADRGALVYSAAQSFQLAGEDDPGPGEGVSHGAFTAALLAAINACPAGVPVAELNLRVRAYLQAAGANQEPCLEGMPSRLRKPLFGEAAGADEVRVTVTGIAEGIVSLDGGRALGLGVNTLLERVKERPGDPPVTLAVRALAGINAAEAEVAAGKIGHVMKGNSYAVRNWSVPAARELGVWMPPGDFTASGLALMAERFYYARGFAEWVVDPVETAPTHVLFWSGEEWVLSSRDGASRPLGTAPNAVVIMREIGMERNAAFFLNLPPPRELAQAVNREIAAAGRAVRVRANPVGSPYHLAGMWDRGSLKYAWVMPGAFTARTRGHVALPPATEWTRAGEEDTAAALADSGVKLARIVGWQMLDNPQGEALFPYRLALRRKGSATLLDAGSVQGIILRDREEFQVLMTLDPEWTGTVQKRHVYLFALDSHGASDLIYPTGSTGARENWHPEDPKYPSREIVFQKVRIKVQPPWGTKTLFMLTTEKPVPNPGLVFQFTGESIAPDAGPLMRLISNYGDARGGSGGVATDMSWSVQRMIMKTGK